MYNLLVAGNHKWWDPPNRSEMARYRVINPKEYTSEDLAEQYGSLDEDARLEVARFPALFAYETGCAREARLGRIIEIRVDGGHIAFSYEFDTNLPAIPHESIEELKWELGIQRAELYRTHWAIKNVDLLPTLLDAGLLTQEQIDLHPSMVPSGPSRREIVVSPTVFGIPASMKQESNLAAVMMPFDREFDPINHAIRRACEAVALVSQRVDDIWEDSSIIQDVFSLLYRSRLVIADLSSGNSNVMYEVGIAHTLGRPVIPIAQDIDDVPFDLRHHRVLQYEIEGAGMASLQSRLERRLRTLTKE